MYMFILGNMSGSATGTSCYYHQVDWQVVFCFQSQVNSGGGRKCLSQTATLSKELSSSSRKSSPAFRAKTTKQRISSARWKCSSAKSSAKPLVINTSPITRRPRQPSLNYQLLHA